MTKHACIVGLVALLIAVALPWQTEAQATWNLRTTVGIMTSNNFNIHTYDRNAYSVELSYMRRYTGDSLFLRGHRWIDYGVKGSYALIPSGIAGDRVGVVGLLEAPLAPWLRYHFGVGLSFYSKPYAFTHDPENIFIGSAVNCLLDMGVDFCIGERLSLFAEFLHTSNGNLYIPNKGLNYLQIGAGWRFGNSQWKVDTARALLPAIPKDELDFTLSQGIVQSVYLGQGDYFPCYDLTLGYQHYLLPALAVGGAVDLWYNHSYTLQLKRYSDRYPLPMFVNAMGLIEAFWGPVSIKAGAGVLLAAADLLGIRYYERAGIYYNWGHSFAGVGVHARAGMVEFVEWSYGYRIPLPLSRMPRGSRQ